MFARGVQNYVVFFFFFSLSVRWAYLNCVHDALGNFCLAVFVVVAGFIYHIEGGYAFLLMWFLNCDILM